jgi:hypothetical protein
MSSFILAGSKRRNIDAYLRPIIRYSRIALPFLSL